MARAQQMMLDFALGQADAGKAAAPLFDPTRWLGSDGAQMRAEQSAKMWEQGAAFWTQLATLTPGFTPATPAESPKDRRFADPDWTANPAFALIRQTYGLLSEHLLETTSQLSGLDLAASVRMAFAAKPLNESRSATV